VEITDPGVMQGPNRLASGQKHALGIDLVLLPSGSAVTGEFNPEISDIDTVAVLRSDLTAAQLAALKRLHVDIVE
jgi:hypothetical protein